MARAARVASPIAIEHVAIADIKPHPTNPRVHPDAAIAHITRSIEEFGWTNPVLLSADGVILAGHARVKAAQQMGRVSALMEIDPRYCDVIRRRYAEFVNDPSLVP